MVRMSMPRSSDKKLYFMDGLLIGRGRGGAEVTIVWEDNLITDSNSKVGVDILMLISIF